LQKRPSDWPAGENSVHVESDFAGFPFPPIDGAEFAAKEGEKKCTDGTQRDRLV
jgi:hypothetical protein